MTVWKLRLFHKKVTCFVCRHSVSVFAPWYIFYMMFGVRAPWLVGNSNSNLGGWVFAKCQLFTRLIFPIKWGDLLICDLFGLSRSGVIWQLVPPHRNRESKASGNRLCTFCFLFFWRLSLLMVCVFCMYAISAGLTQSRLRLRRRCRERRVSGRNWAERKTCWPGKCSALDNNWRSATSLISSFFVVSHSQIFLAVTYTCLCVLSQDCVVLN